ncbi:MAG: kelch repeat-containing protein, partial [Blastocatellia bacterium]
MGRGGHTATLLANGQVLVAGGYNPPFGDEFFSSAELYDPATGTWSYTGNLNSAVGSHTATLLANGKVLVVGGCCGPANNKKAELYDPATGTWSLTSNLNTERFAHTATLLPSGKVLVAGSNTYTAAGPSDSAELYDPATGTWSSTGNLNTARGGHTATLLANGQVLVAGGRNLTTSAELYDPATGTWSVTGSLNTAREICIATLLANGQVLVGPGGGPDKSAELYDPATRIWSGTANTNTAHGIHTATLLPNGKVLVVGSSDSVELFDLGLTQSGTVASVSAASFSSMGLASEAITASFGARLATATQSATAIPLPTSLAGTTVKVKDSAGIERLAPLFFVSPTQVNYQIPAGTVAGAASVTITSGDGAVSTGVALVKPVAPSLFTANGNGQGVAAALALHIKADGSQQLEPVAQFDAAQNRFVARPLDLGPETDQVYLVLFGT